MEPSQVLFVILVTPDSPLDVDQPANHHNEQQVKIIFPFPFLDVTVEIVPLTFLSNRDRS